MQGLRGKEAFDRGSNMVPVTLQSLLELSLRGVEDLVCNFSIKAVSHMAQV